MNLWQLALEHYILLTAVHTMGKKNVLADTLGESMQDRIVLGQNSGFEIVQTLG